MVVGDFMGYASFMAAKRESLMSPKNDELKALDWAFAAG